MIEIETEKLIGTVSHYYSKIGVAVLELVDTLRLGDSIRIVGGIDTDFIQTVESMEIEHEKIEEAKTGDSIGLKVNHRARKGYRVYKE